MILLINLIKIRSILMNLFEKIEINLRKAIKERDTVKVETLRMLKSDISYEKGKTGNEPDEEKIFKIITQASKRRKESIKEFLKADRKDLADIEEKELQIIEEYLPEQMSEQDIEKIIREIIKASGEVTHKDFGKIMSIAMKELKGKADGTVVKNILNSKLND